MWQDQDSFVFLAAINTLVGLADVAPSEALPLLAARLSDETIETPLRLMLTEVLEKAARQCGDVLPHYAPLFVNAFMVRNELRLFIRHVWRDVLKVMIVYAIT